MLGLCDGQSIDPGSKLPRQITHCDSQGPGDPAEELLAHLGIQPGQRIDVEVLPGGRLELHAEHATGTIGGFIGLLADRSSHRASLDELNEAAAAGWAGLPGAGPNP